MKAFDKTRNTLLISLICMILASIPPINATSDVSSQGMSLLETEIFTYEIQQTAGDMNFYPYGMVCLEVQGKINLSYTGEFEEWGQPSLFFDVDFIKADGTVNKSISNVSQSTIGMNLIWGFGGFSPNFITTTNWTVQDTAAREVANAPANESWPGLNGTLQISSENGLRIYDYKQNPNNGTQTTLLKYREESGILQAFNSSFYGYQMAAELINPPFNIRFEISAYSLIFPIFLISIIFVSIATLDKKD